MSTKASISYSEKHHLYTQELLSEEPTTVFLELENPTEFKVEKETFRGKTTDTLTMEIPAEVMDQIAIDWIKKLELQGAVGGPVGRELGSPENPWD
ncbi:hypothetical protein [Marinobacter changyiensis]|uniref:hypothetical protein n=1 Tax=Marinobacter changyiensis TaxID=2604091 RepID=UPI001264655B|nr:hypothetical protein [Marinobacter changyiensis]